MSETPQETLDRAAPIWDAHVVSFTLVLAALRSVLAERDALATNVRMAGRSAEHAQAERDALRAENTRLHGDLQAAEAERDALRAEVGRLRAVENAGHDETCAGMNTAEGVCGCGWLQREGAHRHILSIEAERDALRAEVAWLNDVLDLLEERYPMYAHVIRDRRKFSTGSEARQEMAAAALRDTEVKP